jgi:putative endonuclease
LAAVFLASRGYEVLAQNQRTPLGELDLICRGPAGVVVVEVKARSTEEYGDAFEAIGPRKARRLRAATLWWLADRGMFPCTVRFDAILVTLDGGGSPRCIRHVRDILGA